MALGSLVFDTLIISSLVPRPPRPTAKRWSGIMLQDSWIKRK